MGKSRFTDKVFIGLYKGCQKSAADNWSEMYQAKTTAGLNPMGPNAPRRGASHRCAYWDGRMALPSLYARAIKTVGYACWAAGKDDRIDAQKRIKTV